MSTRAMARMYGGGRNYSPADPTEPGLLSRIFGTNQLSGGEITTTPDGTPIMSPYQGQKGFFNRSSRRKAEELNQLIQMQRFMQMLQSKGLIDVEKERGNSAARTAKIQNRGTIKNTRVKGQEDRLTEAERAKNEETAAEKKAQRDATAAEKTHGYKIREADAATANNKGLFSTDIPRYSEIVSPALIASLRKEALLRGDTAGLQSEIYATPEYRKAFEIGSTWEAAKPFTDAQNAARVQLAPDSAVAVPQFNTSPFLPRNFDLFSGPTRQESVTTTGGVPMEDGTIIGGRPTATTKTSGARIPIPPTAFNNAASLQQSPPPPANGSTNAPPAGVTATPQQYTPRQIEAAKKILPEPDAPRNDFNSGLPPRPPMMDNVQYKAFLQQYVRDLIGSNQPQQRQSYGWYGAQ